MAGMVLQKLRAANEGAFMSAALRLPDPVSKETLSAKPSDAPRLGVGKPTFVPNASPIVPKQPMSTPAPGLNLS